MAGRDAAAQDTAKRRAEEAPMQQLRERAALEGGEIAYEERGTGEPVVLIHAGVCADFFQPLMDEPALTDSYRLVRYHRAGYGGSGAVAGPLSIAGQGAHCRLLLRHLGIERAHVVGHSSSANMALQMTLDAPETVQSLALLEPALLAVPTGPYGAQAIERYRAGDKAGAVDTWMRGVCGPGYQEVMEKVLPGALDQAVADVDTFFAQELPALREWSFGQDEAARVTRPALAVLGARSKEVTPVFDQRQELLLAWLPRAEPFLLADATHLLQVQNARGLAEGLAAFFSRHPIGT
jgi:pimeloyl-ACP methyl ester carboxylesterase